jgi:hypothetical protein
MPRRVSPQTRFLLRASLIFICLLVFWWFLLLPPLLGSVRVCTDVILNWLPGANLQTGVELRPDNVWVLAVPVSMGGIRRNVRVEAPPRLPTQLTIGLPLFWAIILAAPWCKGVWRSLAAGTALLMALPPVGLLVYAAHVVRIYVYPHAPPLVEYVLAVADYVASTVAPYVGPVLLALTLHGELRRTILAGDFSLETPEATP